MSRKDVLLIVLVFSCLYFGLVWIINGGDRWWVVDYIDRQNVFFGDDAYRFFLARSAWVTPSLYSYNYILPGSLFLDGIVTTIAGGDLFWSRSLHALLGASALALVWDSGLRLGINRRIMTMAILIMGLLPRHALMSLSFYGEVWFGFFICLMIWLYLRHQVFATALLAGLLPLIRPEGIFFLVPLWLYMASQRSWRAALVMVLPGILYALFLLISFYPEVTTYNAWRWELRRLLSKLLINKDKWEFVETYSLFLTVPALLGWLYVPLRRLWPILLGGLAWAVFLLGTVLADLATYETRYTYILVPMLTLLWASFFAWLWQLLEMDVVMRNLRGSVVVLLGVIVVAAHLAQLTMVKANLERHGTFWVARKMLAGDWNKFFWVFPPEDIANWKWMDEKIESLLERDPGIDKLVIFDPVLYYNLDPKRIPAHVMVGFPASGYMVFHMLLNGQVFIQHPGGRIFSYLRYGKPDFRAGERRVLYADIMPMKGYPFVWKRGEHRYELYLFSYLESWTPETDIDHAPTLRPEDVEAAYLQWMR